MHLVTAHSCCCCCFARKDRMADLQGALEEYFRVGPKFVLSASSNKRTVLGAASMGCPLQSHSLPRLPGMNSGVRAGINQSRSSSGQTIQGEGASGDNSHIPLQCCTRSPTPPSTQPQCPEFSESGGWQGSSSLLWQSQTERKESSFSTTTWIPKAISVGRRSTSAGKQSHRSFMTHYPGQAC